MVVYAAPRGCVSAASFCFVAAAEDEI